MKFGLLPNPLSARMNAEISSDEKIIDAVSCNGFATIFRDFKKEKRKECVITQGSICGIDQPISITVEKSVLQENGPFRSFLS